MLFCAITTGERSDPKAGSRYGSRVDGWTVKILCGEIAAAVWVQRIMKTTTRTPVCARHAEVIERDQLQPITQEDVRAASSSKQVVEGKLPAPIVEPQKRRYDFES